MEKKILIIGGGRVGSVVAETLEREGHEITIIESDEEVCADIDINVKIIHGDGTDVDILSQVPIEDIDTMMALTGDTSSNLASCLLAEKLVEDIHTVLRVEDSFQKEQYKNMVDVTIFPEGIAGKEAAGTVERVVTTSGNLFTQGDISFMELEIPESSPAVGSKVSQLALPDDCVLVSTEDELVDGDKEIKAGERYLVANKGRSQDVIQILVG